MIRTDTYTRIVLTIIAATLVFLCVRDAAPRIDAQSPPTPTPVIITGINIVPDGNPRARALAYVPVGPSEQPVTVAAGTPLPVLVTSPVKVEADKPLIVRAVPEPGSQRPGW